jgi:hypothetical protein
MHYSNYAQNPSRLNKIANKFAKYLIDQYPARTLILVYRGFSGIALATALGVALARKKKRPGFIYVRKEKEDSHGKRLEIHSPRNLKDPIFIICDDFVSSGETIRVIINDISKYLDMYCTNLKRHFTQYNTVLLLGNDNYINTFRSSIDSKDFSGHGEVELPSYRIQLPVINLNNIGMKKI